MRLTSLFAFLLVIGITSTIANAEPNFPSFENLPTIEDLPDPFTTMDGKKITTPKEWYDIRRPELKQLFQYYMYGYMPAPPGIKLTVMQEGTPVLNGKAELKEMEIRFNGLPDDAPFIRLALFTPKSGNAPYPVFLGINSSGNQAVIPDEAVTVNPHVFVHNESQREAITSRGAHKDFWCVETLIDRGYAFATFYQGDIDPDKPDFTDGIHPYYPNLPGPDETHWGTISAWAWGFHRCIDALVLEDTIDKSKICLIGHSRRGKTALFAAAMDERVALVVPQQSGTGGAALSRKNGQETVERINRVFPHWFNDMFTKFNDHEEKLPIDQHLLEALVAPRVLVDSAGLQDTWANYESAYRALQAADKVYKFLGSKGIVGDGKIDADEAITPETVGNLVQIRLDTKHTLNVDYWKRILDVADVNFGRK